MDRLQYSLTYEGITTILDVAPVSWDKSILKTERQIGVWGVTRAFQFQFEFVKDGADILRNAFYNNGIEADVTILIEKFNYISHEYEEIYSGKINFAKFIDDTVSVKVDAIEGNLPQLLKANENTKYQIAYNDFYRHFQILKDSYKYNQPQINYTGVTAYTQSYIAHPIKMTKNEVIENIGEIIEAYNPSNSTGIQFDTFLYPFDDTNDILLALKNCNISLDIDIKYFWGRLFLEQDTAGFIKFKLRIYLYRYSSTLGTWGIVKYKEATVSVSSSTSYTAYNHYVQWQEVLNVYLGDGDKLAMMAVVDADWEYSRVSANVKDGYLLVNKFNAVIGNDTYNIPCINITDLLTSLGNKITGNLTGIESTYFADKNIIFFSGNAVRGFPNSVLNISFNDIFKFLNSINGAGFGVENNKIVIENRGYFFEDTEIEEFLNSNDFSIEHAEELIYNTVKVGNNSPTIEGKYGNYEPNNQFIFGLPITKIQKELNLISPIRTDSLGIDALRVAQNFSNSDSKDNANDNEIFAVVCKPFEESEVSFFANVLPPSYFIEIRIRIKDGGSYVSTDVTVTFGNGIVKNLTSYTQLDGYKDWYIYSTGYTIDDVNDSVLIEWNNNVDIKYINDNYTIVYGFYEALKTDYTITSGVPTDISADIFNKSLSPKRCLINNSDLLNTALYKQPQSNEVVFLSSLKNNAMVSGGLTENAALKRSEFNAAIFDPIYYNCTVPVSADTWQKILNTPKGYFSVWYKDIKYLGYILEASLNSALRSEMKIKLLAKTPADLEPEDYRFFEHNRTEDNLTVSFYLDTKDELGSDAAVIDWGDGVVENITIETNSNGGVNPTHEYSEAGNYVVSLIYTKNKIYTIDISDNYGDNRLTNIYTKKEWVNLQTLSLYSNQLTSFTGHAEWVNLQYLDLYSNQLTSFTGHAEWVNLRYLDLYSNQLTSFTGHAEWVNLQNLFLSSNQLTSFTGHAEWVNLQYLVLSSNQLTSFTGQAEWVNLQYLVLSSNQLTSFTGQAEWVNLRYLDLSSNQLTSLQINTILAYVVALGTTISSKQIQLQTQTPPAPPSGQGITDKETLISRGYNVLTD